MSSSRKRSARKKGTKYQRGFIEEKINDEDEESSIGERGSFKLEPGIEEEEDIDTPDEEERGASTVTSDECARLRSTAALSQNLFPPSLETKEERVEIPAAASSRETDEVSTQSGTPTPRSTVVLSDAPFSIKTEPVNTAVVAMPPLSIKSKLEEEEMSQNILPIKSDVEGKKEDGMRPNLSLTEPDVEVKEGDERVQNVMPINTDSEENNNVEMSEPLEDGLDDSENDGDVEMSEPLKDELDDERAALRSTTVLSRTRRKRKNEETNRTEGGEKSSRKKDLKDMPLPSKTEKSKTRKEKIIRSMNFYENDKRPLMFETRCVDQDYPNFYYILARDYLRMMRRTLGYHRFESGMRRDHSFYDSESKKISVPYIVDKPNEKKLMDEKTLMRLDDHSYFLIEANLKNDSEDNIKKNLEKLEEEGKLDSTYRQFELKTKKEREAEKA